MIETGFQPKAKIESAVLNENFQTIKGEGTDVLFLFGEPPSFVTTAVFQTAYPFRDNTLSVYIAGLRLVKSVDYLETKINVGDAFPQRITFLTSPGTILTGPDSDVSNRLRINYMRGDL